MSVFSRNKSGRSFMPIALLVMLGILLTLGLQTPAPIAAADAGIAVDSIRNADGTLNLNGDARGTLDLAGWNVTLDTVRGPILSRAETAPQAPMAADWQALPNNGLQSLSTVRALLLDATNNLYVGGTFIQTFDAPPPPAGNTGVELHGIAKYNGASWSALPNNGLNGNVYALASDAATNIYAGGSFGQTFDGTVTPLNRIAQLAGGTTWTKMDAASVPPSYDGLNGQVYAIAVSGTDVYVGGSFSNTVGKPDATGMFNIAKYSTAAKTWSPLAGKGLTSTANNPAGFVYTLAFDALGNLYAGGIFTGTYDGSSTGLNNIARYSAGVWSPVGSATSPWGVDGNVETIAVSGADVFVGGGFDYLCGDTGCTNGSPGYVPMHNIARFDILTNTWSAFAENGLNDVVRAIVVNTLGTQLYVGGDFTNTQTGSWTTLNRVARFNIDETNFANGTWHALPDGGLNGSVYSLALNTGNTTLYAGGIFSKAFSPQPSTPDLNSIAKLAIDNTTAVNVTNFRAANVTAKNVTLKWQTQSETQIAGFHIWRKIGSKNAFQKINGQMLQAKFSGDASGAFYQFKNAIKSGKTYRYKIEVVYLDNHSEWTNVVKFQAP